MTTPAFHQSCPEDQRTVARPLPDWLIATLLLATTLVLYWPVRGFDLIYFDDPLVLIDCPAVQAGLSWSGIPWAFTSVVIANWHPLTNLSFLVVSQLFGNTPGAHHLTNAFIHAGNAALLFLLLRRLTGTTWRSVVVAAVFAWHPQRVESVAWIVERKDVLCAFFIFLSLLFYSRFVEALNCRAPKQKVFFCASLLAFAGALLSKPMAVTLPFVLLLLDLWPLGRGADVRFPAEKPERQQVEPAAFNPQLLTEKWPFFALAALFCAGTYWIQHDYAAMMPWDKLGLGPRIANAISGYVTYLAQLLWPVNLAVIYPLPKSFDMIQTFLKAGLLLVISAACILQFKHRPQLAVGWCWYLGTALPVIGIIQVGEQAMADRYTYLPLIGPVMALAWTVPEFFQRAHVGKSILAITTVVTLSTLIILTARQLSVWRNTIELFGHNIEVTPDNGSAYYTLGIGYERVGDFNRAAACYRVAKELLPSDLQIRRNLASLLARQGHLAAAEAEFNSAIVLDQMDVSTRLGYAGLLAAQNRAEEAIIQLDEAICLNPDGTEALNNLAWLLATSFHPELRNGSRAVTLAQHACELTQFKKAIYVGTLGAAYAEAGNFDAAIATAQKACALAVETKQQSLFARNQDLLAQYQKRQPYHEANPR